MPTLREQIDSARRRLDELQRKSVERAGQEHLIEPSYKRQYQQIESPELKRRIAETESNLYSAPAELRARHKDIYDPRDQERLVAAGQSQLERKLEALRDIKQRREGLASDIGSFALAKHQAGTARLEAETGLAESQYKRLTGEEQEQYNRQKDLGLITPGSAGIPNAVGNKIGGTPSWRNNNPLNIKFGDFAAQYGAQPGSPATDGGVFANFPDEETGWQAARDLLLGNSYRDLNINNALQRWSGGGYGIRKLEEIAKQSLPWGNKKVGQLNRVELNELMELMKRQEGYKEGQVVSGDTKSDYTPTQEAKLEQKFGANWKKDSSRQQQLDFLFGDDRIQGIINKIYPKLLQANIPVEVAEGILKDMKEGHSPEEIKKVLLEYGYNGAYVDTIIDLVAGEDEFIDYIEPVGISTQ